MRTILITGGTGLIGRHLCPKLQEKGYEVLLLSHKKKQNTTFPSYSWDWETQNLPDEAIEAADYIIHLAGANIGDRRWTKKRKQLIVDSRIKTTQLLFNKVKAKNKELKAFISASATGYYGAITSEKVYKETDLSANDFLGKTGAQWEQAADKFSLELSIRTVKLRTGVVLTKQGGALPKMLIPVKLGFGSAIGNGKQYMPWIHIDDLCNIYIKALEDTQMQGAYNTVAPEHVTNKEFVRTAAEVLKKPFWFPNAPSVFMKILFGEMSDLLLKGSRVSAQKIQNAGYNFLFPDLKTALSDLL